MKPAGHWAKGRGGQLTPHAIATRSNRVDQNLRLSPPGPSSSTPPSLNPTKHKYQSNNQQPPHLDMAFRILRKEPALTPRKSTGRAT